MSKQKARERLDDALSYIGQRLFAVGRSGGLPALWCTEDRLYHLGEHLAPGSYWISECHLADCNSPYRLVPDADDWGTLEVRSAEDWDLRSLDGGIVAGPGFVIV